MKKMLGSKDSIIENTIANADLDPVVMMKSKSHAKIFTNAYEEQK